MWQKTYGGPGIQCAGYSVEQTSDNGYILAGVWTMTTSDTLDLYLVKTNANGDTLWTKTYGGVGTGYDQGYTIKPTIDGGYIIGAYTSFYDFWLLKIDSDGNVMWENIYGGVGEEYGWAAQQTSDQGYVIMGVTYSFGAGDADIWLIKTGSEVGTSEYQFPQKSFTALQVSPYPFKKKAKIRCMIQNTRYRNQDLSLKIYDAAGRLVRQWNYQTIGQSDQITWYGDDNDGRKVPTGIYFLKLSTPSYTETKKLLLIR
jgi:hypothetical protein